MAQHPARTDHSGPDPLARRACAATTGARSGDLPGRGCGTASIDGLITVALIAHHLILFAREASSGRRDASHYTLQAAASGWSRPNSRQSDQWRDRQMPEPPKARGGGLIDLAAARRHAHHREPALVGAVAAEAEQPVDAGKARRIGQHLLGEALRALRLAPAPRPAPPRHRRASRCAPGPGRSARDSAPRNCGSRCRRAPRTSRRAARHR